MGAAAGKELCLDGSGMENTNTDPGARDTGKALCGKQRRAVGNRKSSERQLELLDKPRDHTKHGIPSVPNTEALPHTQSRTRGTEAAASGIPAGQEKLCAGAA